MQESGALDRVLVELKTVQNALNDEIYRVNAMCNELERVDSVKGYILRQRQENLEAEGEESSSSHKYLKDDVEEVLNEARQLRGFTGDQSKYERKDVSAKKKSSEQNHSDKTVAKSALKKKPTITQEKLKPRLPRAKVVAGNSVRGIQTVAKGKERISKQDTLKNLEKELNEPAIGVRVFIALHGRLLSARELARTNICLESLVESFLSPNQQAACTALPTGYQVRLKKALTSLDRCNSVLVQKTGKVRRRTQSESRTKAGEKNPEGVFDWSSTQSRAMGLVQWFRRQFLSPWLANGVSAATPKRAPKLYKNETENHESGELVSTIESWSKDLDAHLVQYFLSITANNLRLSKRRHISDLLFAVNRVQKRHVARIDQLLAHLASRTLVPILVSLSTRLDQVAPNGTHGSDVRLSSTSKMLLLKFCGILNVLHLLVNGSKHNRLLAISKQILNESPSNIFKKETK